jgi:tetratricopeptide (TPR) repeat protein
VDPTPTTVSNDEVADLLDKLVSKSLIVFDETTHRYHTLEMVRQYARETQLADIDRGALQMHERHAHYFLDLLNNQEYKRSSVGLQKVETDYENIRAAMDWWAATEDHLDHALEMASSLYPYWYARGMLAEGANRIESILKDWKGPKNEIYGHALWAFGDLSMNGGRHAEAKDAFEEVKEIALSTKDIRLEALAYGGLAGLHQDHLIDFKKSLAHRNEALRIAEKLGDQGMIARNLYNLGDLHLMAHPDAQDPEKMDTVTDIAGEYFERARPFNNPNVDTKGAIFNRSGLGRVALRRNDFHSAREHFSVCLRLSIDAGYLLGQSMSCFMLAHLAHALSDFPLTAKCLSKALDIAVKHDYIPGVRDQEDWMETMQDVANHLSPEELERLVREGAQTPVEHFLIFFAEN